MLDIKESGQQRCDDDSNQDAGQVIPVDAESEHKAYRHVRADAQKQHQYDQHDGPVCQQSGEDNRDQRHHQIVCVESKSSQHIVFQIDGDR